jgi:Domain of unknown function (DUF4224)
MILSPADIKTLTGYVRASAQIRWLRRHGWKFAVNALGNPIVALAEFNRHLVGGRAAKSQEVNLEGIND